MKKQLLFTMLLSRICLLHAQSYGSDGILYNSHDYFTQTFNPPAGNEFRSANGTPGPMYWQNSASYLIHATLNEKDTSIKGEVRISYTNNSPDSLDYLWFQLDQNLFDLKSRGVASTAAVNDLSGVKAIDNGGFHINKVSIHAGKNNYEVYPVLSDTRMQIRLHNAMRPKGDRISIQINYSFIIPADGSGRMGRLYTKGGVVYQMAQWYPRMCVYDDVEGWNTLPYMGLGEFYCDYGTSTII